MTVIRFCNVILRILIFIVLLPVLVPWILLRLWYFRFVLVKNMTRSGMPKKYAKQLARETKLKNFLRFSIPAL